jgi:hypothetical protein
MYESAFHQRQVGRGERWRMLERIFEMQVRRLGLDRASMGNLRGGEPTTFRRPERQTTLF